MLPLLVPSTSRDSCCLRLPAAISAAAADTPEASDLALEALPDRAKVAPTAGMCVLAATGLMLLPRLAAARRWLLTAAKSTPPVSAPPRKADCFLGVEQLEPPADRLGDLGDAAPAGMRLVTDPLRVCRAAGTVLANADAALGDTGTLEPAPAVLLGDVAALLLWPRFATRGRGVSRCQDARSPNASPSPAGLPLLWGACSSRWRSDCREQLLLVQLWVRSGATASSKCCTSSCTPGTALLAVARRSSVPVRLGAAATWNMPTPGSRLDGAALLGDLHSADTLSATCRSTGASPTVTPCAPSEE